MAISTSAQGVTTLRPHTADVCVAACGGGLLVVVCSMCVQCDGFVISCHVPLW